MSLNARSLIRGHYREAAQFQTLRGRLKLDYKDQETDQGFSASLRMQKDRTIWISATFGVVKVLLTPEKASFYNKLDKTFFEGDYRYISTILGAEVDFYMIQNLLLGMALTDLRKGDYEASATKDRYQLTPRRSEGVYKFLLLLEPETFRIASQQLSQPEMSRMLRIDYPGYQKVGTEIFPSEIRILASQNFEQTLISLVLRNLELNVTMNYPYEIPQGYEPVEVE